MPELTDREREYLDTKARGEFLAKHQHVIINAVEVAAATAPVPELAELYGRVAEGLRELPCAACRPA